jgi:hypothetical protein
MRLGRGRLSDHGAVLGLEVGYGMITGLGGLLLLVALAMAPPTRASGSVEMLGIAVATLAIAVAYAGVVGVGSLGAGAMLTGLA